MLSNGFFEVRFVIKRAASFSRPELEQMSFHIPVVLPVTSSHVEAVALVVRDDTGDGKR